MKRSHNEVSDEGAPDVSTTEFQFTILIEDMLDEVGSHLDPISLFCLARACRTLYMHYIPAAFAGFRICGHWGCLVLLADLRLDGIAIARAPVPHFLAILGKNVENLTQDYYNRILVALMQCGGDPTQDPTGALSYFLTTVLPRLSGFAAPHNFSDPWGAALACGNVEAFEWLAKSSLHRMKDCDARYLLADRPRDSLLYMLLRIDSPHRALASSLDRDGVRVLESFLRPLLVRKEPVSFIFQTPLFWLALLSDRYTTRADVEEFFKRDLFAEFKAAVELVPPDALPTIVFYHPDIAFDFATDAEASARLALCRQHLPSKQLDGLLWSHKNPHVIVAKAALSVVTNPTDFDQLAQTLFDAIGFLERPEEFFCPEVGELMRRQTRAIANNLTNGKRTTGFALFTYFAMVHHAEAHSRKGAPERVHYDKPRIASAIALLSPEDRAAFCFPGENHVHRVKIIFSRLHRAIDFDDIHSVFDLLSA